MDIEIANLRKVATDRVAEMNALDKKLTAARQLLDKKTIDDVLSKDTSDLDPVVEKVRALPVADRSQLGNLPIIILSDGNLPRAQQTLYKYTRCWNADIMVMRPEGFTLTEEETAVLKKHNVCYAYHEVMV